MSKPIGFNQMTHVLKVKQMLKYFGGLGPHFCHHRTLEIQNTIVLTHP